MATEAENTEGHTCPPPENPQQIAFLPARPEDVDPSIVIVAPEALSDARLRAFVQEQSLLGKRVQAHLVTPEGRVIVGAQLKRSYRQDVPDRVFLIVLAVDGPIAERIPKGLRALWGCVFEQWPTRPEFEEQTRLMREVIDRSLPGVSLRGQD